MIYFCSNCKQHFYGLRSKKSRCVVCGKRLKKVKNKVETKKISTSPDFWSSKG